MNPNIKEKKLLKPNKLIEIIESSQEKIIESLKKIYELAMTNKGQIWLHDHTNFRDRKSPNI